jgi:hypothetical protein
MMHTAVAVFSGKSKEHLLRDGGTQSWRLVPSHAAKQEFVVCCRSGVEWVEGAEERGSAFIVGRLAGVEKSIEDPDRYLIKFSEYADVAVPHAWKGWRNPVKYTTLEELGIDATALEFKPMPKSDGVVGTLTPQPATRSAPDQLSLTIAQAKRALARQYEVSPEAIEITIRG